MYAREAGRRVAEFINTLFLLWFAPVGVINGFDICREINGYVGFDTRLCCDPDCGNVTKDFFQCKFCIQEAYCDECVGINLDYCTHCAEWFCGGTHSPVKCQDCGDIFCLECAPNETEKCEICQKHYCNSSPQLEHLKCHDSYVCSDCCNDKQLNEEIVYCQGCDEYYCCNKFFWREDDDEYYCSDCWEPRDADIVLDEQPSWRRN